MESVIYAYKPVGMTPLELIEQLRNEKKELQNEKLAYAGRLDPMAEGQMIILVGDECKNRKHYERLSKEYEFEILIGISTDTYDIMGKITDVNLNIPADTPKQIELRLSQIIGKQSQPYPPYSSARVKGRPLFYWAREGKLHLVTVPKKEIEIYNLDFLSQSSIQGKELEALIHDRINKVNGNFRQKDILEIWERFFMERKDITFTSVKLRILCSSGTYVRSIAHTLGVAIGIPFLALSIKRTAIT